MSDIDSFLDGVAPAAQSESQIDSFLGTEEKDGAFIRGFKKANDKLAISANLAVQDPAGAAQSVATADTYAKNNQGMPEGAELMGAWDRGDGISGGISEVAGEIGKDWGEARGLGDKFKSVGTNARAMGEGKLCDAESAQAIFRELDALDYGLAWWVCIVILATLAAIVITVTA